MQDEDPWRDCRNATSPGLYRRPREHLRRTNPVAQAPPGGSQTGTPHACAEDIGTCRFEWRKDLFVEAGRVLADGLPVAR